MDKAVIFMNKVWRWPLVWSSTVQSRAVFQYPIHVHIYKHALHSPLLTSQ